MGRGRMRSSTRSGRLQDDEMFRPRPQGRGPRHRAVEGNEPASPFDGESEQVDIGHLAWSMNAARIDPSPVEEAGGGWPELVVRGGGRQAQALDRFYDGDRARITGLG